MSRVAAAGLALLSLVTAGLAVSPSKILEKEFPFPPPVQWKSGDWEVSVIGVAWGLANSPKMISKGHKKGFVRGRPRFFSDRPYVLAIEMRGYEPNAVWNKVSGGSGLLLVKNVSGDFQVPLVLTPTGFIHYSGSPGVLDMSFNLSNKTEFWDFFPVSPHPKGFLFQAFDFGPNHRGRTVPRATFRVLIRKNSLTVVNLMPGIQSNCSSFSQKFSGTIGSNVAVRLQLTAKDSDLSGTEQYVKVGKTLWLAGHVDSFGNFILHEQYPKDHLTGIFKGRFTTSCHFLTGYFSKPDGSELLPFRFGEDKPAK